MNPKLEEGSRIVATTSWSAIVAGVAVALALEVLLLTFGLAIGLSVGNGRIEGGYALWAFLVQLIALAIGGAIGARVGTERTRFGGLVVGAMVWAVAIAIGAIFATISMTRMSGAGMWSAFFGMLLGLGGAMAGGIWGATRLPEESEDSEEVPTERVPIERHSITH